MTLMMRDRENIEKGLEQGLAQGLAQGLEQGIAKRDRMLIVKWSAEGRTTSEIANLLDIPEEQVRRIQLDQ